MKKFLFLVTAAILNGGRSCRTQFWNGTIPAKIGLIWFSGFREEDLNVILYQNMPNLHNRYKSAERNISQKNPEYQQPSWMGGGAVGHNFERDPPRDLPCHAWFNLVQRFQRRRFKCDLYQNMPNLHNRYKSAERKITQKNPEYVLNYSLPCSCS